MILQQDYSEKIGSIIEVTLTKSFHNSKFY